MVTLLLRVIWAISSKLLFCQERPERIAHGCSLIWAILSKRVNSERANSQPWADGIVRTANTRNIFNLVYVHCTVQHTVLTQMQNWWHHNASLAVRSNVDAESALCMYVWKHFEFAYMFTHLETHADKKMLKNTGTAWKLWQHAYEWRWTIGILDTRQHW